MNRFINIKLRDHCNVEIKNIKSVMEEEKGVRVRTAEGHEIFVPFENLLYYSISAESEKHNNK